MRSSTSEVGSIARTATAVMTQLRDDVFDAPQLRALSIIVHAVLGLSGALAKRLRVFPFSGADHVRFSCMAPPNIWPLTRRLAQ